MKHQLLLAFSFGLLAHIAYSQSSLTIEAGQNFTTLSFTNELGEQNTDLNYNHSGSVALGYEYGLENGIYFNSKLGLRNGGASFVYDDFNYRWDLSYADIRLGVGYRFYFNKISLQFSTQAYYAYLYKAEQRLHNLNRDMLSAGSVEKQDIGIIFSPGIYYPLSENVNLGIDLMYMLGLTNIETDPGQETYNRLLGGTLGLRIDL